MQRQYFDEIEAANDQSFVIWVKEKDKPARALSISPSGEVLIAHLQAPALEKLDVVLSEALTKIATVQEKVNSAIDSITVLRKEITDFKSIFDQAITKITKMQEDSDADIRREIKVQTEAVLQQSKKSLDDLQRKIEVDQTALKAEIYLIRKKIGV